MARCNEKLILILALGFAIISSANGAELVGRWKTVDDDTHKPKSIVEIYKSGDTYRGKIVKLIDPKEPNAVCKKCSGENKDKPLEGMDILWDLKTDKPEKSWTGGTILDPENGKSYSCNMSLDKDSDKLKVRGYIGFSLLGRTQFWDRQKENSKETGTPAKAD